MPHDRIEKLLTAELSNLADAGHLKGAETVFDGIVAPNGGKGPRYQIASEGNKTFLRMNANNYLGMARQPDVIAAEEEAVRQYGAGPGAVRFISGTWTPHIALEQRLAAFHDRGAAMIFSSAYATIMGVLPPLVDERTAVISDQLNHNCIINAMRLAQPKQKRVYPHVDIAALESELAAASEDCERAIIVTDGVFSMRGDHAPLRQIMTLARRYDDSFTDNVLVIVDDSHGVGAFGTTGRGTEEVTGGGAADVLVGTLGKAFGVNGGYVTGSQAVVEFLRETSPFYIYSNPITPGEAAAAKAAIDILDSPRGIALLGHLRAMMDRFKRGLRDLGFETVAGKHPVIPLMVRDTDRTKALVRHLRNCQILATGLGYPVVPRGDEEIRFQISADHTAADIDEALAALKAFEP
jgi:glycine C-acetyltransferase